MNSRRASPSTGGSGRFFTAWARSRNRLIMASISSSSAMSGDASARSHPRWADPAPTSTTTSTEPPTTTTAPPTTVAPAPPSATATTKRPTVRAAPAPAPRAVTPVVRTITSGLGPYKGLGTWADVYDWSNSYTNNKPGLGVSDIDRMASVGVQTLYIQAAFWDAPTDIVDRDRLMTLIARAHQHGIQVIAWYLPTLEDLNHDLGRLMAVAQLPVEGISVDIESRKVADVAERNRRLVALS